jgi:hypothetical protein
MTTKKLNLALAAIIIAGAMAVTSCKKKDTPAPVPAPADTDQSGATANNTAESTSSDIETMGSQATDLTANGSLGTYRTSNESVLSCATVVRDTINKTVTVTFSGNVCLDGKTRTGSITYNYSGSAAGAKHYRDPGFKLSITSNNYAVNGNTVTITNKTIVNTTPAQFTPSLTNETWSISATISVSLAAGGSINWTCNRVKTLLNTAATYSNAATPIAWANAKVGITGTAGGTRDNGETFGVNITSQLIRDFGACNIGGQHPFIQGVVVYTPTGKSSRIIDYGPGTCDLDATVTIDGVSHPFTLP